MPRFISAARVGGALLMALSSATTYWLLTAEAFVVDPAEIEISGIRYTDPAAVASSVNLAPGNSPSVFSIRADRIERALVDLPAVESADVRATLPDRLVVSVVERQPVVAVRRAAEAFLIDPGGVVLDRVSLEALDALGLPVVDDNRDELAIQYEVAGTLDATELSTILHLGALTPTLVGSRAERLTVAVDDDEGYVMTAEPFGWRAVFGHYTPTLRPPSETIPRQVECLRSLLAGEGEAELRTVYLAPLDERCGTFEPRTAPDSSPRASPTTKPAG